MKKRRNIYLSLILFLIVFFCFGIDAPSILNKQISYLEISPVSDNNENRLFTDIDSAEEDPMDQLFLSWLPEQPDCQKSHLCILPPYNNLFLSVWQPPKIF